MPRARDPHVADRLLHAAARVLASEGRQAVTARRLATEVGTSTMAVYTHFGSMDDLLVHLWRDAFARFGAALDHPGRTADPVADWAAQGWAYRSFALEHRHLYRVMFAEGLLALAAGDRADHEAAAATFRSLLARLERAATAGRLVVDDVQLAGEVVWATVHGHMTLELAGYFAAAGRTPEMVYGECLHRLGLAFGDDPDRLARSLRAARRRALSGR